MLTLHKSALCSAVVALRGRKGVAGLEYGVLAGGSIFTIGQRRQDMFQSVSSAI